MAIVLAQSNRGKLIALLTAAFLLLAAGSAEARFLSAGLAKSYIRSDGRAAARSQPWAIGPELGKCQRARPGQYECQVQLSGRRPVGYSYEYGTEYEAGYCAWVAVAHYRGRHSIVVNRREFSCERWFETSR